LKWYCTQKTRKIAREKSGLTSLFENSNICYGNKNYYYEGSCRDRKGENKIDVAAVNDLDKVLLLGEFKLNEKKIDLHREALNNDREALDNDFFFSVMIFPSA
jgi:hypothetical protein